MKSNDDEIGPSSLLVLHLLFVAVMIEALIVMDMIILTVGSALGII